MHLSDEDLIQKSLAGQLDAFDLLVRRYEGKIYSLTYRFMGNHADAHDLAQETFIRLYLALGGFRGDSSFATWLYRIAANTCRDELRKRKRRPQVSMEELTEISSAFEPAADAEQEPEEVAQRRELQRQVQECLNQLSDDHRLILIMREMQELSYEEISQALDCSMGTVKSRISRARQALREKIKANGELLSLDSRLLEKGGKQDALPNSK